MGRPIKKKFFANLNAPYQDQATGGPTGVGGEGISTITVSNSGTVYSQGSTVVVSAPQIPGGIPATVTTVINSAGNISVTPLVAGSGYTSASLSVTKATTVSKATTGTTATNVIYPANKTGIFVGMTVTGTGISASTTFVTSIVGNAINLTWPNASNVSGSVTFTDAGTGFASSVALTATQGSGLSVYAFIPGGSSGVLGDIMKQEASKRYLVNTAQGIGQCKLVAVATGSLVAGEMNMLASDTKSPASTYYVTKLTAHKAVLTRATDGGSGFEYATGDVAGWTIGSATTGTVSIANS